MKLTNRRTWFSTDVSSKLNSSAVNVSITPSAAALPESPRDPADEEDSEDENEPPLPVPGHRVSVFHISAFILQGMPKALYF